MSLISNSALLNGGCHITTLNPMGDSTIGTIHKSGLPSNTTANGSITQCGTGNGDIASVNGGETTSEEEAPCIDIIINNVVCAFSTKCYLNLKKIATEGIHVEYRRENGMCNMKLRRPNVTATMWSSGNVTCTGSTSEDEARMSARRVARRLQKLGFNTRFTNYRVVNVLGTCSVHFGIKLGAFSQAHPTTASYEPELHPGVTYKIKEPKATLKIFSTGSITVTAPCVANIQHAIEHIYPLVLPFKMDVPHVAKKVALAEKRALKKQGVHLPMPFLDSDDEDDEEEEDEDEFVQMGRFNTINDDVDDDFSDDFDSDFSHE